MNFGTNLRNMRIKRGLTQQALAKDLNISQGSITAYENGTRIPPLNVIEQIADYFRVPITELLPVEKPHENADSVNAIAESLHTNMKLKLLFDRTRYMDDTDLDAVLAVANAISRERKE
jgi:transcriptional regulator with XRE-family HTH domain